MAREVLDVQRYPDLRQYPGGPPERPYDAAGWTLPLQMGVTVVAAATPLAADVAREDEAARPDAGLEGEADAVRRGAAGRRAVRQRAGHRLRHRARRPRPSCRRRASVTGSGTGAGRSIRRRTTPIARINRAWKQGASVPVRRAAAYARRSRTLRDAQQADLVKSLALVAERTSAPGARRCKKPRIGLFRRGAAAWTRAGRAGCSSSTGSTYVALRPADFKSPLDRQGRRRDPGRRCAAADGGRGGRSRRRRWRERRWRRAGPARVRRSADAGRPAGVRAVRPRRRHARLPQQRERRSRSSSSSCRSATSSPACGRGVLPARHRSSKSRPIPRTR